MRNIFSLLLIMLVTFGLLINDADAKRFGGGRSFGTQRNITNPFSRAQPAQISKPASTANKWLGPLAGLAAGGLLASLFMGHGVGGSILSWLAIAGVLMFIWSLVRNKLQGATQPMQYNQYNENASRSSTSQYANVSQFSRTTDTINYPVGFDSLGFIRDAKVQFIRLQAAFDSKNLNDLHEFTTPEVFAEIQLQIQERGDKNNYTDVVTLDAEILDVATESQTTMASVRFSGTIREELNGIAEPFNETWHFRKDNAKPAWVVAGVQQ